MESSYNPHICTAVFTPLAVGLLLSAFVTAQSVPQTVLEADRVVVLKERAEQSLQNSVDCGFRRYS